MPRLGRVSWTADGVHLPHFRQACVGFEMTNTQAADPSLCPPFCGTERYGRRNLSVGCLHVSPSPKTSMKSWWPNGVLRKKSLRAESRSGMPWFPLLGFSELPTNAAVKECVTQQRFCPHHVIVCGCQGTLLGCCMHEGVATSEHTCKGGPRKQAASFLAIQT